MASKEVIQNIEAAINRVCEDIKQKKGSSGAEKLDALSKLINSYSRMLERDRQSASDPMDDGDPHYYAKLEQQRESRRNIIR
jgi:molybdenum-dependent DNA-binding transcriptional regulator ModE